MRSEATVTKAANTVRSAITNRVALDWSISPTLRQQNARCLCLNPGSPILAGLVHARVGFGLRASNHTWLLRDAEMNPHLAQLHQSAEMNPHLAQLHQSDIV